VIARRARLAAGVAVAALRVLGHAASRRPLGLVVAYHRIEPRAGDAARELVPAVAAGAFARELRCLRLLFRVVPAADVLAAAGARRRGGRIPVAVTLDDEWPTHASLALPALRRAGVRATFFLTGAHLDGTAPFWWEALQHAADAGVAVEDLAGPGDLFAQAARLTAAGPAERAATTAALQARAGPGVRSGMSAADVRAVAREHDVGFHTARHDALTTLGPAELARALQDGRAALEAVAERPLRLLAYPHGAAGPREAAAAAAAGFELAFTTRATACGPGTPPALVGRVEPGVADLAWYLRTLESGRCAAAREERPAGGERRPPPDGDRS
jgi:peptidoglycan/xylan/chitin deacetylase (PgdA/CDA1 family)